MYPIAIASLVTIIFVIQYFYPDPTLSYMTSQIGNWGIIFAAYAMAYGLVNLVTRRAMDVIKSRGRNLYSLWILITAVVTSILGIFGGIGQPQYSWIYTFIYSSLGATLYSFSYLYTASAGVRVLRVKNLLTALFLFGAVFTLLGDVPAIRSFVPQFFDLRQWITGELARGPYIAFNMSVGIGIAIMGLRVIIGAERRWAGIED
jgi:hypothetical protein